MKPLDPFQWLVFPLVMALLATFLLTLPIRVFGQPLPEPIWPMVLVFAWAVIRPSLLAPFAVLIAGVALDLLWGGPFGLWAVSLLVAYGTVSTARTMLAGQSRPMMWAWYGATTLLAMGCAYALSYMDSESRPGLLPLFWQFLITMLIYPFSDQLIDRFEDADVRFR
jgi:rod shape-determining protein MreD